MISPVRLPADAPQRLEENSAVLSGAALLPGCEQTEDPVQTQTIPLDSLIYHRSLMQPSRVVFVFFPHRGLRAPGSDDEDAPAASSSGRPRFTLLFRFVQRGASDQSQHLVPAARLASQA